MKAPKLTKEQQDFIAVNAATMTQRELAEGINRHQSIVAKYLISKKINSKYAHRSRKICMADPPKVITRPPATYTQHSSPYGISDQIHQINFKN